MFERIVSEDGRVRLQLKGALDAARWAELRPGLEVLAAAPGGDVVLDLTNVRFIDGPGVGAIGFLFKRLRARHRRLLVTGVSGQPLALLHDHGLDRVLDLPRAAAPAAPRGGAVALGGI
ncbi:MAG: STAS domain-containing protein [Rhodospirillales bacterium]|nr:STAS domain-containing protein [Rhodospirillales bacterium]MDE2197837.1 STAS domain-containing protein [Rhodospirillales bacterium]MDE2574618.1 STAS domain-containing protein [Rhodospirillales bacterium]